MQYLGGVLSASGKIIIILIPFFKYLLSIIFLFPLSDNVIIERECQKPCQHTVCQACYFKTKREPPCPRCAFDDFQCMAKFAKCVRKDTCTRHKYPCEPHQKVLFKNLIFFVNDFMLMSASFTNWRFQFITFIRCN